MHFSSFSLSTSLQKSINAMGFEEATPIQAQAIPLILEGRDMIGCAQTGTGKTAAFLLPALEQLLQNPSKGKKPRVVILAPTRELVIQVADQARKLASRTSLRIASIYGGAKMKRQVDRLRKGVDVVVATPGRLQDHMRRKNIQFSDLEILVLDEADRMLDMGFLPDIEHIISKMPQERQTLMFSATMSDPIMSLTHQFQRNPEKIEISIARPPQAINQTLYPVHKHLKTPLLIALIQRLDVTSALIFSATKQTAEIINRKLTEAEVNVTCIHGDFKQRERVAALEGFRSGKFRVLVATNIAARGLDIEGISHVINYDVPTEPEEYIHRIGRTARADAKGNAITLVTPDDEALIHRIEYLLDRKVDRKTLPDFDYDVPIPSWAQPSAKTIMTQMTQSQSLADRWRSMSRGGGRRRR
ncbi:MAG: DEAD/DEAH box helicase [Chloroflexota bacterium]